MAEAQSPRASSESTVQDGNENDALASLEPTVQDGNENDALASLEPTVQDGNDNNAQATSQPTAKEGNNTADGHMQHFSDSSLSLKALASKLIIFLEGITKKSEKFMEYLISGKDKISILFIGKVGTGKSALINGIMGKMVAEEETSPISVTQKIKSYERTININEIGKIITIEVWDTPGMGGVFETEDERETLTKQLAEKFKKVDLVFYCIDMNRRFETIDLESLEAFSKKAGPNLWQHTIFVLTRANEITADPMDEKVDAKTHFRKVLAKWIGVLNKLAKKFQIPEDVVKDIPIVPTGYRNTPPPDREDWFTPLWVTAFDRMTTEAQPSMLVTSVVDGRLRAGPEEILQAKILEDTNAPQETLPQDVNAPQQETNPENKLIHLDQSFTGYTLSSQLGLGDKLIVGGSTVIGAAGGAVAGAKVGTIVGSLGGPVGAGIGAVAGGIAGVAVGGVIVAVKPVIARAFAKYNKGKEKTE